MNIKKFNVLRKSVNKSNPYSMFIYLAQLLLIKLNIFDRIYTVPNYSPIYLRNGTSDIPVFREIYLEKEYDLTFDFDVEYIIDGGANIGISSRYLLAKFPNAKIIAVEPEQQNFAMLERNVIKYKNITGIRSGIWYKDCLLRLVESEQHGEWGFQLQEVNSNENRHAEDLAIQCYSVDSIMTMFELPRIDILKLDIEGAERELFQSENPKKWIHKCKAIVIELHAFLDSSIPKIFFECLEKHVFYEHYQSGENTVVRIIGHK